MFLDQYDNTKENSRENISTSEISIETIEEIVDRATESEEEQRDAEDRRRTGGS